MWSDPHQDSSDNPEPEEVVDVNEVLKPVRLHIRLNSSQSTKKRHATEGHKKKKRLKYICRKCNIPRFRGRSLFRQHLISHINTTEVNVVLSRLKLPEKVVIRASKYYATKYPIGVDLISTPSESSASKNGELPQSVVSSSETLPVKQDIQSLENGEQKFSDKNVNQIESATSDEKLQICKDKPSKLKTMASQNNQKISSLSVPSDNSEENRGKGLMEELGFQMNKLAGSFFRNDLQSARASSMQQHVNNSGSPHVRNSDNRSPPPLVVDSRSSAEILSNMSILPGTSTSLSLQMQQAASVSQNRSTGLPPQLAGPQSAMQIARVSSPTVAPRVSPLPVTATASISAAYRVSSPQSNGSGSVNLSPRMSPQMTPPPLLQRAAQTQGLGGLSQNSSRSSTPSSPVTSQSFAAPAASHPVNRPSILVSNSNVPNERCDSVVIIEKPTSSAGSSQQAIVSVNSRSLQIGSTSTRTVSISQIQNVQSTSTVDKNPLAMLRQLDPAKSMPTNISLQAINVSEEQARPASVMILENPRENTTPKFNIGNIVSLAPGYNNQMFGHSSASTISSAPPYMPHLLQDITSNCTCSTCTDIRSGDLIRRSEIMIQAGHYEYKCPKCIRRFAHKSSLLRHIRSSDHGYVCDLCSSAFLGHVAFECHKRLHKEKSGILPTTPGLNQSLPAAQTNHQLSNMHAGTNQMMHPPPPPLLSSMNRRMIINNASGNRDVITNPRAQMAQQRQQIQRHNPIININNRVVDDDVIVVGERHQPVSRALTRLPPPPPLERAPRSITTANNNRMLQERISMATVSGAAASNNSARNISNQVPQRGSNAPSKTTPPLPAQSQLARIFNNSEITLTPIGNEGNARRLEGITITPMPNLHQIPAGNPNMRQAAPGNSNMVAMGSVGQPFTSRMQQVLRANSNVNPRFASTAFANVRQMVPTQPSPSRPVPFTNMNRTPFSPNIANRASFNPQMQNPRMTARGMLTNPRANQPSNIMNNEYMAQLSTAMRQNVRAVNSNRPNPGVLASRSEAGTHTAYRMMPVANVSHVQMQQSNQHLNKASLPMWHHPVSTESYGANVNLKNSTAPAKNQNMSVNVSNQASVGGANHLIHRNSNTTLPSSSHSSGPNRFPIPPIQQVPTLTSSLLPIQNTPSTTSSSSLQSRQMTPNVTFQSANVQRNSPHVISNEASTSQQSAEIVCPFCKARCSSSAAFHDHCRQNHNLNNQANEPTVKFTCSKCQEQFGEKLGFEQHQASCQEKIPCIRCHDLIHQDRWAAHCAEFHATETQSNPSTIKITNPFESGIEINSHTVFATDSHGSLENSVNGSSNGTTTSILKDDIHVHHTSSPVQHDLAIASVISSGLNDPAINSETPTDDDVLVHDLSLAAASEIQLINDTVKDIADNGGTKVSNDEPSISADDFSIIHENKSVSQEFTGHVVEKLDNDIPDACIPTDVIDYPEADKTDLVEIKSKDVSSCEAGIRSDMPLETEATATESVVSPVISNDHSTDGELLIGNQDAIDSTKVDRANYTNNDDVVSPATHENAAELSKPDESAPNDVEDDPKIGVDCEHHEATISDQNNSDLESGLKLSLDLSDQDEQTYDCDKESTKELEMYNETDTAVASIEISDAENENCNRLVPVTPNDSEESDNQLECLQEQEDGSNKIQDEAKTEETSALEKEFLCPICDQKFDSKKTFLKHIKIHQNPQQHTCHLCNSSFGMRKNLVLHLRSHMKSCSKKRRHAFTGPVTTTKRPRRDSDNSAVPAINTTPNSKLMVAVLDMNKVAANVGFLQRMGVVGLISLDDLKLHVAGNLTAGTNSDATSDGSIPIVNLSTD